MYKKTLTSSTIIPETLYIERAADRQLREIIDNMGRPGYVLVSRQMGKTNLLINMKREHNDDVVLYLDLSNRLESARAWFRYVIDSLLESYSELFQGLHNIIRDQRQSGLLEPNVEYDRHLRLLLKATKKKFIIVLDEIDSLVNTPYSDTILAQVRSMYFSRVNFPEYERATYVLSGVAEPTDLIKDKNISPFNIGEKIYLSDFTRKEFDRFLSKAGLAESHEIASSIYKWTNGNPRMTWDVCSELEDRLIAGDELTQESVNKAVEKLYLRDFDRPPIDHIRTLVETDKQIRDAIIAIRFGHADFIDDRVKSKLYLSGITKSNTDGTLDIKNEIIDNALSDRWLTQLSYSQDTLIAEATANYHAGNYEYAIWQYEQAAADEHYKDLITLKEVFELALCYFWLNRIPKAIELFKKCIEEAADPDLQQSLNYYIGLAEIAQGAYQSAISHLLLAAEGPSLSFQLEANLNLIPAYIKAGSASYGTEALNLSDQLIAKIADANELPEKEKNSLIVAALYNKSVAHRVLKDKLAALNCLEKALEISEPEFQPALLLLQQDLSENNELIRELCERAASVIIESKLKFENGKMLMLRLRKSMLALLLSNLARLGSEESFRALSSYASENLFEGKPSVLHSLIELFYSLESDEDKLTHHHIIIYAVKNYVDESSPRTDTLRLFRALASVCDVDESVEWCEQFINEFSTPLPDSITEDDVYALLHSLYIFRNRGGTEHIPKLTHVWDELQPSAIEKSPLFSSFMLFHLMSYLSDSNEHEKAVETAKLLLKLMEGEQFAGKIYSVYKDAFIEMNKHATKLIRQQNAGRNPYKHIGRNQRVTVQYSESQPITKKFKQVQADLLEERCQLLRIE